VDKFDPICVDIVKLSDLDPGNGIRQRRVICCSVIRLDYAAAEDFVACEGFPYSFIHGFFGGRAADRCDHADIDAWRKEMNSFILNFGIHSLLPPIINSVAPAKVYTRYAKNGIPIMHLIHF